jgi:RNA polymerase sigma-70 factor (ECF subfamily)
MDVSATIGFRARIASPAIAKDRNQEIPPPPVDELEPDEQLMCKVNRGDREALSNLFRRYAVVVRSVGKRILRDTGEAEDLVQEVFLYIHRKSSMFDSSKGSATSWIIQVAYTQALLRRRRLKSQGFYMSGITDKPDECDKASNKGADYDHTVEGLFGRNGWKKIAEDLTQDQRETFRLHFFEGYTFTEIAEKLAQSYANVRNHHYRGLEKLRRHLAEDQLNRR